MQVREINHGVACRIGNVIYLNKNLKNYPKLRKAILRHEKEHTSGYEFKDVSIDLKGTHLKSVKTDYYRFIVSYPKSFTNFAPFWIYENKFVIDPIMCVLWAIAIGVFVLI
ncbi:MAG TPA: hypothetical protein ENG87_03975 [Candidatus Pacearchaeota archaeon]|nr:hypothetical protein [Candidatus Pacearchaeota archaeon]HDZ61189.1 hypothetical protein [Candidatus Pacearchaeota archaeon]